MSRAHTMIRSIPTRYCGTLFASTLEADWAATFDRLGWYWEYEPEGVTLPGGVRYRPDFHLPAQKVWCEVKGPHNERIGKAAELQEALLHESEPQWRFGAYLVVVLRPPGPGEMAHWEGSVETQDMVLVRCSECDHVTWMDYNGIWTCRLHLQASWERGKPWLPDGALYRPGDISFARAPRPPLKGAV